MSLIRNIKNIFRKIKNVCYLMKHGYSKHELYSFNIALYEKLIDILSNKEYDYYWNVPYKYVDTMNVLSLTEEQQQAIIDTFIFHLKMCDEYFVIKTLYNTNDLNDSKIDYMYVAEILRQNEDRALTLLRYFINDI